MKRKILRNMARKNMEKKGFTRLNKKSLSKKDNKSEKFSTFSVYWRDYV